MSSEPQVQSTSSPPAAPLSATSGGVVADRTAAIFRNVYNSLMSFEDEINECHNELRRLHVSSQLQVTTAPSATTRDYEALLQQRLQFAKRMRDTQHQHLTTLTNAMYLEQEEGSTAATAAAASPMTALRQGPTVAGVNTRGGGGASDAAAPQPGQHQHEPASSVVLGSASDGIGVSTPTPPPPPRNFFERVFGFQEMAYETTRSCFLRAATFLPNATSAATSKSSSYSSFLAPLPSSIFEGAVAGSNSTIVAERCMIDLPRLRSSAAACGATLTTTVAATTTATPLEVTKQLSQTQSSVVLLDCETVTQKDGE
ncbi:Hypothetical protein, putative [Bodo saltans]|uniref:Uncharacterized protein n=1 Tax=Bodo saltans TaxID=75058 RepID=A0A0S4JNV3_BODSA|nr:Hypothetical protein, putative [Bodo saltans]|eukprot:CUG93221.1 Hypothetical protein, putative [Bodo saltans]